MPEEQERKPGRDARTRRSGEARAGRHRLKILIGLGLAVLLAAGFWGLRRASRGRAATPTNTSERRGGQMTDQKMETLAPGQKIEHRLPGGEKESYGLALDAGSFTAVAVEQRGLDVVVRLFDPSGEALTEVDSPTGNTGVERVTAVADTAGTYRLEVEAFTGAEPTATYVIHLEARRPATDADRTLVAADRVFAQGEDLRRAKKYDAARTKYREALDKYRSLENRQREADALNRAGWMDHELEKYPEAVDLLRQALTAYEDLGNRRLQAATANRLGRVLLVVGQLGEAEKENRRALDLFVELGDRNGEADAANNLGNVYKWSGRTEEALAAYERAQKLWQDLGNAPDQVTAQLNIADVYLDNGDAEIALSALERALAGARDTGFRRAEAAIQVKAGEALMRLERFDEARKRLQEALAIRQELDDRRGQAVVLGSLATLGLKTGALPEAHEDSEKALRLSVEVDDSLGQALAHQKLGRYYYAAGDPEAALKEHELALPLFEHAGDRRSAASARFGIARALYASGDYAGTRKVLEEVLSSAESLRADSASLELRSSYFASRRRYWDLYIACLMRLHEQAPDSRFDLLALQATERWRARGLLDLLAEAGVQIRDGAPQELLDREQSISTELDALARERLDTGRSISQAALHDLSSRETKLLLELDRTRSKILRQSSRFAELSNPDPLNLSQIQRNLLDPDTLLVTYFLGEERSFLWTVSRKSVASHVLPPRSEIETAAKDYYELLSRHSRRAENHRAEVGAKLGEMLLGPIAQELQKPVAKRLVVVADGALHYLPFTALPAPAAAAQEDGELLIDHHEVVRLPSASVLASLRRGEAERKRAPKTIAVIADPVFEKDDPRIAQASASGTAEPNGPTAGQAAGQGADSGAHGALGRALRDARSGSLRRLPGSAEEARAILALVPKDSRFSALGFDASYPLVDGDRLAKYRIIHFATHGLIDRTHPELSGLALSLFDRQGEPQRGFLRLHDIYNLHLDAQLVVLSACDTGLGEELEGEGLVGLTRGFLYAGTPRVIQSLWEVGDASTAELMRRFYEQLLQKDLAPAAALREAQLSMRRDPDWSSPLQWAAFVFQGDWRGTEHRLGDDDIETADTGGTSPGGGIKTGEDLPPPEPPPAPEAGPPPPLPAAQGSAKGTNGGGNA